MKYYSFCQIALCVLYLLTACTEATTEMEYPSVSNTVTGLEGGEESLITATVTLSDTDRLDDQLEAVLGAENKYIVQDLTILGSFYGVDVETLHKLRQLKSINMRDAVIKGCDDERAHYAFAEKYAGQGNFVLKISESIRFDNDVTSYFFYGMETLKQIELPSSAVLIATNVFAGTTVSKIEVPSSVTFLGDTFANCHSIERITVPKAVNHVALGFVDGCEQLHSIIWETSASIEFSRPNDICLLYLEGDGMSATINGNWPEIVTEGAIENLNINTADYCRNSLDFSIDKDIIVSNLSISVSFSSSPQTQSAGISSGWRTIVFPFDVEEISSEKVGTIAPFGSQVDGAKPFWLRELTSLGFVEATKIKANTPYIIAMPNNPEIYIDEYNISGIVTFSASNVNLKTTTDTLQAVEGPDFALQPTYKFVKHSPDVYALNYGYPILDFPSGSVFARFSLDVYAFEAYAFLKTSNGVTEVASTIEVLPTVKTRSMASNKVKRVPLPDDM